MKPSARERRGSPLYRTDAHLMLLGELDEGKKLITRLELAARDIGTDGLGNSALAVRMTVPTTVTGRTFG